MTITYQEVKADLESGMSTFPPLLSASYIRLALSIELDLSAKEKPEKAPGS